MKLYKEDSLHYSRNIKIAIIISELFILCLFTFTPSPSPKKKENFYFPENIITVADIPSTKLDLPKEDELPPPRPSISVTLEFVDELEVLPDVVIPDASSISDSISSKGRISENKGGEYYASSFPFVPRQILEVVPSKIENVNGYIKFSLKIGKEGFVKEYRIIASTINDRKQIKNILDAVYKSRWQPITIEGNKVEYWIDKTYSFN
ncbi:hypothetical protein ABRY23_06300 [Melioribacteraceae bacterium 4301-Me]|uniref:hypothetical protein n=1 Tax=Pyranulibacter aquaticus TaxID=3163344 RepID=UPI003597E066